MKRGDLYRVEHPTAPDPRRSRVFVVVSRQLLIGSRFSTVICAPVYSVHVGLTTQVAIGEEVGLKHASGKHCDELVSIPKVKLTNYVGSLSSAKLRELNEALGVALELAA